MFPNALLKECLSDPIPLARAPHQVLCGGGPLSCGADIGKQPVGDRAVPGHSDGDSWRFGFLQIVGAELNYRKQFDWRHSPSNLSVTTCPTVPLTVGHALRITGECVTHAVFRIPFQTECMRLFGHRTGEPELLRKHFYFVFILDRHAIVRKNTEIQCILFLLFLMVTSCKILVQYAN